MTMMSLLAPTTVVLALSLGFTIVAAGGANGDCPGALVKMSFEEACRGASSGGTDLATFKLCMDMVRINEGEEVPAESVHEATKYARHAAGAAMPAHQTTWVRALYRIADSGASLPAGEKAAYEACFGDVEDPAHADIGSYGEAYKALDRIWHRLPERCGRDMADDYKVAMRGVAACRERLAKLAPLWLRADVEADYNRTLVVYHFGKLLLGLK